MKINERVRMGGSHVFFYIVQWQRYGCGCVPLSPPFSLHVTKISTDKQENEAACINALTL